MIKKFTKDILKKFNVGVLANHFLETHLATEEDITDLLQQPAEKLEKLVHLLKKSKSQIRQDLFVLMELDFKKNGFFVEFGGTNGIDLSNTWLLEKEFDWKGIIAEPAKSWHKQLMSNRSCHIETDCVWRDSTSLLNFSESTIGELSTITDFKSSDTHKKEREKSESYTVKTISLNDLLDKYHAPTIIDYLSIDTEGSEFEILSHFDFSKYSFRVITVEHNFTPNRERLISLLTDKGYKRKYTGFSKFDDWYILEG